MPPSKRTNRAKPAGNSVHFSKRHSCRRFRSVSAAGPGSGLPPNLSGEPTGPGKSDGPTAATASRTSPDRFGKSRTRRVAAVPGGERVATIGGVPAGGPVGPRTGGESDGDRAAGDRGVQLVVAGEERPGTETFHGPARDRRGPDRLRRPAPRVVGRGR